MIENDLSRFPQIIQAAVTDIEVKQDARLIMAFYTANTPIPQDELTAFIEKSLAGYKRPRSFFHVDSLPIGANSKLLRRKLQPIYEALK